jgi:hypothetical protein
MCQLDSRNSSLLANEGGYIPKLRNVLVLVYAQVSIGNPAFCANGSGFLHYKARSSYRPASQVNQVPIAGESIHRRILAHGGNSNPVF